MKCPVCKTECHELKTCPECGFKQLNPEFINRADMENWIQNVVWPHRERYWEQIKTIFNIENRKLQRVDLEEWIKQHPFDTEIILSVPYGVDAIERSCFCRLIPIDGPYVDLPPVKTVYIPQTVSAIDPLAFESVTQIALDRSNPYYYVCDAHLIDRRTSALVTGPRPLDFSNFPEGITQLSARSCCFSESDEHYVYIPDKISVIDMFAITINSPSCRLYIPKTVSFIKENGIDIKCWNNQEGTAKNVYIFCEHDSRPDTWDEDWVLRTTLSGLDCNIDVNAYVFWKKTWHYENGKPVPNNKSCGDLVPVKYIF